MKRTLSLLALAAALVAGPSLAASPDLKLERVVIVMRHGVRPPTKPAAALASLAEKPWPDDTVWGAAPGELTPRGAVMIRKLGRDFAAAYARDGLWAQGAAQGDGIMIWADGADERTRETGRALASGLRPSAPPPFGAVPDGQHDPLFSNGDCPFDPAAAQASIAARGPVDTPATAAALTRLQQIAAPGGCSGGAGPCLAGATTVEATARGLKLNGPVATGASLAENMLLEYENGLAGDHLGWGRLTRADLDVVMAAHGRDADYTRHTPYIGVRRASALSRLILTALREDAVERPGGPQVKAGDRMVVLVGHDTNLSNLGGTFDLDWTLPGQPDVTAPGTALAFERWRDRKTGKALVRVRIFYQDPDQVRSLSDSPARTLTLETPSCRGDAGGCTLERFAAPVERALAEACPGAPKAATRP